MKLVDLLSRWWPLGHRPVTVVCDLCGIRVDQWVSVLWAHISGARGITDTDVVVKLCPGCATSNRQRICVAVADALGGTR
ncbi:MAG: hypothetical protein ACRDTZ_00095 [Pseudonocardiaceae bacterium]